MWAELDERAAARDAAAEARDRVADERDVQAELDDHGPAAADTLALSEIVARAASDRAAASSDRAAAASDRIAATGDRLHAREMLRIAHTDSLTGVYTREQGLAEPQHEIDRCRRAHQPFVLAFIDIDGLKHVNDTLGHAAGDALIRKVAAVVRNKLRTYDPIVRIGGDEFLCGLPGTRPQLAVARVQEVRRAVEHGHPPGTITVGYADLNDDDTLSSLIDRADHDMYEHRATRRAAP